MKILITGATGFVGKNLQEYLQTSHETNSLSVRYIPNQQFKIDGDALIHLSGKAHDLKNVIIPQDYYDANFELTKQLFDAFLISDASVFVFMSTVKAVADKVKGILTEEFKPNPKTHYGIAKHLAENYILSKKVPDYKRVYVLRPCMIHGPGNKGNLNLLYKLVAKGLPWPLGDFENKRSFLNVENLCFVVREILENKTIVSGVYQVADNETLSTNDLIKLLGASLGKKTTIWKMNALFIKMIARLGNLIRLPLNSERLQKLTEDYVVSNEKIVNAIGKSLPISTQEGLRRTLISFKK